MQRQLIGILGSDGLVSPTGEVVSRPAAPEPRTVAVRVSQVSQERTGERTREPLPRRVVAMDAIDEFNALLAAALKLARDMSESDKRRASNILEAARGVMTATTYLDSDEQRRFEAALRNA